MRTLLGTPEVCELGEVVASLASWQDDSGPIQLHPGDLGWFWRFGVDTMAAALRAWRRDGRVLAVGLLDEPDLLRLAVAPDALYDEELASQMSVDVLRPERGVFGPGDASVEAPAGSLFRDLLLARGWDEGERWTPLRRDLAAPVAQPGIRIEVVAAEHVPERVAVQRASFESSTFTEDRWHVMASGLPYADARCLIGYDEDGGAVAAVTVWSAGAGRPGLIEPMGVPPEHRGLGYGKAITEAAAAALRSLGSSSAIVSTPSANAGAVATYRSGGFHELPEKRDLERKA